MDGLSTDVLHTGPARKNALWKHLVVQMDTQRLRRVLEDDFEMVGFDPRGLILQNQGAVAVRAVYLQRWLQMQTRAPSWVLQGSGIHRTIERSALSSHACDGQQGSGRELRPPVEALHHLFLIDTDDIGTMPCS
jgi:hypothetical protein